MTDKSLMAFCCVALAAHTAGAGSGSCITKGDVASVAVAGSASAASASGALCAGALWCASDAGPLEARDRTQADAIATLDFRPRGTCVILL